MIATPGGVLSKYFYGVEYDPTLLRQSLLEASGGTVGSRVQRCCCCATTGTR